MNFATSHHPLVPTISCFILILCACFLPIIAKSTDTLIPNNELSINQSLISAGGKFELGFFSKGNPIRYYIGIWYKDIPSNEIVWVGNRDNPAYNSSCTLKLEINGNLTIPDNGSYIWSTTNQSPAKNPVLQLLDSGNLVIREADDQDPENYVWQSFDHPTDTLIPGQKLGWNLKTGLDRYLSSWRAPDDPSTGNYTITLNYHGDPEIYLSNGNQIIFRSGPWVGQRFSGVPQMRMDNSGINFTIYNGSDEVYYSFYIPPNDGVKSRLQASFDGYLKRWIWASDSNQWNLFWYYRKDICDTFRDCGSYGICNSNDLLICHCPRGFKPKNPQAWNIRDGSDGCVRNSRLDCQTDGFLKMKNMKLPQTSVSAFVDRSLSLDQCRDLCKRNCSCTAYANSDWLPTSASGCIIWTGELVDMKDFAEGGQDLYIRLAASDLGSKKLKAPVIVGICIAAFAGTTMLVFATWLYRRRKKHDGVSPPQVLEESEVEVDEFRTVDSLQFDLRTIRAATNDFSMNNKLGEGGFGEVYKGVLGDGQEIAIKRLSKSSRQGIEEFKNEVALVARLQHKNLVKFLGFCLASGEKILVYEFLQNSSLDKFLFDAKRKALLDWETRFKLIFGIARGLLYLHEDSRLKIIHRDLKPSNILLDESMSPKISDFGLAKLFEVDQTQDDTKRIVGTYGYMAPEYAMIGHFSVKSDVYSFGVMVLEIVSGQKNRVFGWPGIEEALLHKAWRLWNEGEVLSLVDNTLANKYSTEEVIKCFHIALLCIQENPAERPRMPTIVAALNGQSISLSEPKAPSVFHNIATTEEVRSAENNPLIVGNEGENNNQLKQNAGQYHVYSGTQRITNVYPR